MSIAIMDCPAGSVVRPLHSHKDIEEVILILDGQGEAWIDEKWFLSGRRRRVLSANSRHQVRSTGDNALITASIFSAPTNPDNYVIYEEDAFDSM